MVRGTSGRKGWAEVWFLRLRMGFCLELVFLYYISNKSACEPVSTSVKISISSCIL